MRLTEEPNGDVTIDIDPNEPLPYAYEVALLLNWGTTPRWLRWWRRLVRR